jgi:hypothetical protein
MSAKERKANPEVAAIKLATAKRLIDKLEVAHRNGTLKPVNPDAKPVTMQMRVKGD